jgi:hypothetical protein
MNRLSVQELRQELRERGVSSTGSKKQLQQRLADLFDTADVSSTSMTPSSSIVNITSASSVLAAERRERGAAVHVSISPHPPNGKSSTLLVPLHWVSTSSNYHGSFPSFTFVALSDLCATI